MIFQNTIIGEKCISRPINASRLQSYWEMQFQTERREFNDLTSSLGYAKELSPHRLYQQRV